jgi:hypothetical protein
MLLSPAELFELVKSSSVPPELPTEPIGSTTRVLSLEEKVGTDSKGAASVNTCAPRVSSTISETEVVY